MATKPNEGDEGKAAGLFSWLQRVHEAIESVMGKKNVGRAEAILAVIGALDVVQHKNTVWGYVKYIFALILFGVDKVAAPFGKAAVTYLRLVRVLLPLGIVGTMLSFVIMLCGIGQASLSTTISLCILLMLAIVALADYATAFLWETPEQKHRAWRHRIWVYLLALLLPAGFVLLVVAGLGHGDAVSAVLSGPYVLIFSAIAIMVLLPALAIAYWLAKLAMQKAEKAVAGEKADKTALPSFSDFFFKPILTTMFFVVGTAVTFKLIHFINLPPDYGLSAVLAIIVLGIAAIRTKWIRRFMKTATVSNMLMHLGLVVALCLVAIILPSKGDQGIFWQSLGNIASAKMVEPIVHSQPARPAGDVNYDYVVDEHDLWAVSAHVLDDSVLLARDLPYGDVNGDGKVDEDDLRRFHSALDGKEKRLMLLERPDLETWQQLAIRPVPRRDNPADTPAVAPTEARLAAVFVEDVDPPSKGGSVSTPQTSANPFLSWLPFILLALSVGVAIVILAIRRRRANADEPNGQSASASDSRPIWRRGTAWVIASLALLVVVLIFQNSLAFWIQTAGLNVQKAVPATTSTLWLEATDPGWVSEFVTSSGTKTSIWVEAGSTLMISAAGEIVCEPNLPAYGPGGAPYLAPKGAHYVVDSVRCYSLLARVDDQVIHVAQSITFTFIQSGVLKLAINERWPDSHWGDNSGRFLVKVTMVNGLGFKTRPVNEPPNATSST